jgi:hypothetical protein
MKVRYYANGCDGYIAVTDQSPKDFKGVLFIGKGPERGGDPTSVVEQVFAINTLQKLTDVPLADVPAEWVLAFGYEYPVMPKPEPQPAPEPEPDREVWTQPEPAPRRRRQPPVTTVIDVEFPWETATRRYNSKGEQVTHWWEIAAIIVGAIVALVILWPR